MKSSDPVNGDIELPVDGETIIRSIRFCYGVLVMLDRDSN